MRVVTWAAFYEGSSDALYYDVLLPRLIRDLVTREGKHVVEVPDVPALRFGASGRTVGKVAAEACDFRAACDSVFIHADSGGKNSAQGIASRSEAYCVAMAARCNWPRQQCVTIIPCHETEAWLIADAQAVTDALGYRGDPADVGLPSDARAAERLGDPKLVLRAAIEQIAGRRRAKQIENVFPAIANRQRLEWLRRSTSFVDFEENLRICLRSLDCVG